MESLYSITVKTVEDIDMARVSIDNVDNDALLVTGGRDNFLFMLSNTFLAKFQFEDHIIVTPSLSTPVLDGVLSPDWGYNIVSVEQVTPNSVNFVFHDGVGKTKNTIAPLPYHRAIIIRDKGCVAAVRAQLKEARHYKREITIKIHKM